MNTAYLLLGTNSGDRITQLKTACLLISSNLGKIIASSSVYETSPWGIANQPEFLNMVIEVEVTSNAEELLKQLLSIETKMGRVRDKKWEERLIDLDILYFNNEIITKDSIKVPHAELHNRRFTLVPLVEIAADSKHPVFNVTNKELLKRCVDDGTVEKYGDGSIVL